ncbi:hypothetical protein M9H77_17260 [Catharanthus roseus]|uniref:Uncharacterized protein n=1 Tax=Catharanthus roseus TaxID=4058 RepID=A0ACC0B436_CATRO|nr:hypothetical protein M9H77_17260 [Catharanthus roseus]
MIALDVSRGAIGTPNLPLHNSQPARGSTNTLNHSSNNSYRNEAQVSETNVIPRLLYTREICSSLDVQITSNVTILLK